MEAAFRSIEFFAAPEDPVDFPGLDTEGEEDDNGNSVDEETEETDDDEQWETSQHSGGTLTLRVGLFVAAIILVGGAVAVYYRFWRSSTTGKGDEGAIMSDGGGAGAAAMEISHPFPSPPPSSMECIMDTQQAHPDTL